MIDLRRALLGYLARRAFGPLATVRIVEVVALPLWFVEVLDGGGDVRWRANSGASAGAAAWLAIRELAGAPRWDARPWWRRAADVVKDLALGLPLALVMLARMGGAH